MKNIIILSFLAFAMTLLLNAQTPPTTDAFRAFDGQGNQIDLPKIVVAIDKAEVVFLGEQHDDPTAHALEFEILKAIFDKYGKERSLILSMEMFERDSQIVVDEYLQDLINESNFIAQSRAWNNYKTDYRPLLEFAKNNKFSVIAANAPRRYVNRVSRLGRESLDVLSPAAKSWLAPLPYPQASEKYAAKFNALMGEAGTAASGANHNLSRILDSQSLWDATMADSIAKAISKNKNALIVHVNGGFHTENRLGTVETLLRYQPKTRAVVITIKSSEAFPNFDKATDLGTGDFVILTDPKLPRSFKQN